MTNDERIKQLNQQIFELRKELNVLLEASDQQFLEEAKVNIGRCFFNADTNTYAKVINVPQVIQTMRGSDLNRYQYPAIFIGKNPDFQDCVSPFYEECLFSGAWGIGYDPKEQWKEISSEIFNRKFQEVQSEFQSFVINLNSSNN